MNLSTLKSYAPAARRAFLRAVTDRAAKVGLTASLIDPVEIKGDFAFIGGQAFPKQVATQRRALDQQIEQHGFAGTMAAAAYTWFNRFMAIRYMELHGYLSHGYRVLSSGNGRPVPEIVEHAERVDLPGVNREQVIALKLDGTKDEELYRLLLLGQCRALHDAMPFLFERIDDATELLLPDLLLATDSVIRKLVDSIEEADWERIEIIGWLYQFYISEKKDEVIGKVVKTEDIPAATQLFTPNWIVKYMTQNSLGRMWLATYPNSALKAKMEYYIEPAEQTAEVQAQLDAITPKTLDPEAITLIDPACGSGHILVEAYDLFKEIYLERGYRVRDIPRLILTKNLYGLEIDDRAAQMAGFALLMKARADDRSILADPPALNVLALQSSEGMNAAEIAAALLNEEPVPIVPTLDMFAETKPQPVLTERRMNSITEADIAALIELFAEAKTFGSLITIPDDLAAKLSTLKIVALEASSSRDLLRQQHGRLLSLLVHQADTLSRRFDLSVMNPPYMGSAAYAPVLKAWIGRQYADSRADLYGCFMSRATSLTTACGIFALITIPNWMFLSSFGTLRNMLAVTSSISTLLHNGRGVFRSDFGSCAFTAINEAVPSFRGSYRRLFERQGSVSTNEELSARFFNCRTYTAATLDFEKVPGRPIAYWMSPQVRGLFTERRPLRSRIVPRPGLSTTDNERFIRLWHEVAYERIGRDCTNRTDANASARRWFPINKGGNARRWYGNNDYVVNWQDDGREIKQAAEGSSGGRVVSENYYFRESVSASAITSATNSYRYYPPGALFDVNFRSYFDDSRTFLCDLIGFLNSKVVTFLLSYLSPTVALNKSDLDRLPVFNTNTSDVNMVESLIALSRADWDSFETSPDFQTSPLLNGNTVCEAYHLWEIRCAAQRSSMRSMEERNNRSYIEACRLQDELCSDVAEDQITLARADREQDMRRLISYAIGCLMGRYSLDEPGLIYANSGGEGFAPSRYKSVPADDDGILPMTEIDWFGDEDTATRFSRFVAAAWPPEALAENVKFVADSLGPKADEEPLDTIRRYLATGFFADHLKTYKRRPIYWLFSSGKERAFQALVYLHRYNEGTLARMRTTYVLPLMSKMSARIDQLATVIESGPSAAERRRRQNELTKLRRQSAELQTFGEKLRHYSDMQIKLDLNDGVKVNYSKFGDLLAEVRAVTGGGND